MKNGQIFAHKSTARGGLDLEYLDETSRRKVSLRERADMDQQIGKKLKHFTDYASKETLGQVHAGGFLHHSIRINQDGTSTAPSQLSNAERKHRITETWRKHLAKFPSTAKRPVIAHRLVFSMSKEQHDALTDAGINPDQVLHSTMKKVMRRFNERYHPNDSIGYAYGIHHDTAQPPRACRNLSAHRKWELCRLQHVAIQPVQAQEADGLHQIMVRGRELPLGENSQLLHRNWKRRLSKRLDADRLVFSPRLNHLQMNALQSAQNSDSFRLLQLYQAIRNLEASVAARRQGTRRAVQ